MKYLLVRDIESHDGYGFEETLEFDSYDDLVNAFEDYRGDNPQMYEIARMIRPSEVIGSLAARKADMQTAREAVLAKLTPSERQILGITE